ncbi:hypothetical protein MPC4_90100 [Methylocella tundrae]|uniref:Uncharacterized protein n=1 Tax=Methylocella tundrae TaxID=227605 RepID=A0A8B6MCY8_METTU|nr:hypothetical protein [Methylocella tundrae]VTZ25761.1 hypothetical protein MPC1_2550004 [Methylocella tundrae]VTZ52625.1 hypothetical protein MPC4_90100 [Methylocella tundrae]
MEKDKPNQKERFTEAARELGCDENESHFEEKLKQVARHKPPPDAAAPTRPASIGRKNK